MGRMPPTSPLSLLKRDGERERDTHRKRDFNMNFAPFNVRVFSFSSLIFLFLSPSLHLPRLSVSDGVNVNMAIMDCVRVNYWVCFCPEGRLTACLR